MRIKKGSFNSYVNQSDVVVLYVATACMFMFAIVLPDVD